MRSLRYALRIRPIGAIIVAGWELTDCRNSNACKKRTSCKSLGDRLRFELKRQVPRRNDGLGNLLLAEGCTDHHRRLGKGTRHKTAPHHLARR